MEANGDSEEWNIGRYWGRRSICINLKYDGKKYHYHDYGGILPTFVRLGLAIRKLQRQSGIDRYYDEEVEPWSRDILSRILSKRECPK